MIKNDYGMPPGTLVNILNNKDSNFEITVINYDENNYNEYKTPDIEETLKSIDKTNNTWIHIENLNDITILEKIGKVFNIHSLILEDIVNFSQRPKMEDHGEYLFVSLKNFYYNNEENSFNELPISLILGNKYVISIQNKKDDFLFHIRDRIKNKKGFILKKKTDYLMYSIIDIIIDNYIILLENINLKFEKLEDEIIERPSKKSLNSLYYFKNRIINLQKSIWPLRELINSLRNSSSRLIDQNNKIFLNDLNDHVFMIFDNLQTIREMISNMFDMYLSSTSNRMNEIMKVLSIIGTIFIPLTFIAGIYGMNFTFMPELDCKFAYPAALGLMLIIAAGMIIYFKIKKWF